MRNNGDCNEKVLLGIFVISRTDHVWDVGSHRFDRVHVVITHASVVRVHVVCHITYSSSFIISTHLDQKEESGTNQREE